MMLKPSSGAIVTGAGLASAGEPIFQRLEPDRARGERLARERGGIGGVEEDEVRAAVGDHPGNLRRGGGRLDRRRDAPRAQRPEEHDRLRHRRIGNHRHCLALRRAVALQSGRDAIHRAIERGIAQLGRAVGDRALARLAGGMKADQIGQQPERPGEHLGRIGHDLSR